MNVTVGGAKRSFLNKQIYPLCGGRALFVVVCHARAVAAGFAACLMPPSVCLVRIELHLE